MRYQTSFFTVTALMEIYNIPELEEYETEVSDKIRVQTKSNEECIHTITNGNIRTWQTVNPIYRKMANSAAEVTFQVHLNLRKPSAYRAFLVPLQWEMFPLKRTNKQINPFLQLAKCFPQSVCTHNISTLFLSTVTLEHGTFEVKNNKSWKSNMNTFFPHILALSV